MRNWDTVGDNVQSHEKKKERRIHKLLLRQIQMNSADKGNPQIPRDKVGLSLPADTKQRVSL